MSYDKIRSICIETDKVFITSASNNVRPLSFERWECPSLSKILKEKGKHAVDIEILKSYEEGTFQEGTNKYTKALKVLRYVYGEEYFKFNWRNHNAKYDSEEYHKERALRDSDDFKALLSKALNHKLSKPRFIIYKNHHSAETGRIYAKVCPTCVKWKWTIKEATKFYFEAEAKNHIYEKFKDDWGVMEI